MKERNLHIPPDTRISSKSALSRWKDVPPSRPEISPRTFKPGIVSHELLSIVKSSGSMFDFRRMLREHKSPSGLLFRCEDILTFITRVIYANSDFPGNTTPVYFSGKDMNLGPCIRTTTSIVEAATIYGPGWNRHFGCSNSNINWIESYKISVSRAHLLLLAIDPGDAQVGSGMDIRELGIIGPVPLSRIYILNRDPSLAIELAKIDEGRDVTIPFGEMFEELFSFTPGMERLRSGILGPHGDCRECRAHMMGRMNALLREFET